MKTVMKWCSVMLLGLIALSQAAPTIGSWGVTGGWEELFLTNGLPGQTGNQISASGTGWSLVGTLDSVISTGVNEYTTTYTGGWIKLFDGPWGIETELDNTIDAFTVTTTKYYNGSAEPDDSNLTRLTFGLTGSGIFTSFPDYSLSISGFFDSDTTFGLAIPGYGMMGDLTSGEITIAGPAVVPVPNAMLLSMIGVTIIGWLKRKVSL